MIFYYLWNINKNLNFRIQTIKCHVTKDLQEVVVEASAVEVVEVMEVETVLTIIEEVISHFTKKKKFKLNF